jgi:hypothetical protein
MWHRLPYTLENHVEEQPCHMSQEVPETPNVAGVEWNAMEQL